MRFLKHRRRRSQNVKPPAPIRRPLGAAPTLFVAWAVSLLAHAGLFMSMFFVSWLVDVVPPTEEEIPIALTELKGEPAGDPEPANLNLSDQAMQATSPWEGPKSLPLAPKRSGSLSETITAARPELAIIGIGTGGGQGGDGLELGGGGGEPGPTFFGLGREAKGAKKIVYVVDRSGSMLSIFPAARRELRSSIERLRMTQRFHVIFFSAGQPLENPPKRLVPATHSQKSAAFEFLDTISPEGSTDPIPAMKRALAVKPDLVYFLTDGDFDPALIERLREWNRGKQVRIFTVAYVSEGGRVLLEQIARENDGEFRFVSEDEIF